MTELTYGEIYNEFCECNPKRAEKVIDYRPWGSNSILIYLNNGNAYKCKRYAPYRFNIQMVSEEDIKKKFN